LFHHLSNFLISGNKIINPGIDHFLIRNILYLFQINLGYIFLTASVYALTTNQTFRICYKTFIIQNIILNWCFYQTFCSHFLQLLHFMVSTTGNNRDQEAPIEQIAPIKHKFRHIHRLSKSNPNRIATKESYIQMCL
jgi:hypothetical protein